MDIAHANLDSSLSKDCILFEGLSAVKICRKIKKQKAGKWTVQCTWGLSSSFFCSKSAGVK